jgi:hypothetical protein
VGLGRAGSFGMFQDWQSGWNYSPLLLRPALSRLSCALLGEWAVVKRRVGLRPVQNIQCGPVGEKILSCN